jgi:hypothetical protein
MMTEPGPSPSDNKTSVTLISADGQSFKVHKRALRQSTLLSAFYKAKSLIETSGPIEIKLDLVTGPVLSKIVEYMAVHGDDYWGDENSGEDDLKEDSEELRGYFPKKKMPVIDEDDSVVDVRQKIKEAANLPPQDEDSSSSESTDEEIPGLNYDYKR